MPGDDPTHPAAPSANRPSTRNLRTDTDPSEDTCPVCNASIESTQKVGEVTHVLDPCGHQVDEDVHEDLLEN